MDITPPPHVTHPTTGIFCSNCGKTGHTYNQCKTPIVSMGVVAFTVDKLNNQLKFLMIRRKHTLGFMDFMRGKYSIYDKEYILNLIKEMTLYEKECVLQNNFDTLWKNLWSNQAISQQYKIEEEKSRNKFNTLTYGVMMQNRSYTLKDMIEESLQKDTAWDEPEWGFPKGRRNYFEKDIDCAVREFTEETGYSKKCLQNINNIQQYEEIFMGSNYKSYKHRYYVMKIDNAQFLQKKQYDKNEVSKLEWKTFDEALKCIRDYNLEKKKMIRDIYNCLNTYKST